MVYSSRNSRNAIFSCEKPCENLGDAFFCEIIGENIFSGQSRLQRSIAHLLGAFPLRFVSLRRPDSAPITCDFIVKVQLGEEDGDVFPVDLSFFGVHVLDGKTSCDHHHHLVNTSHTQPSVNTVTDTIICR